VIAKYNGIVTMRNNREQAFADIDVQLKLRFDLIPNLVETVKGYASHEKDTLTMVTEARTKYMNASSADAKMDANNQLAAGLKSIFALAESYPDLKANTNFLELQRELSDVENKLAAARRFFNSTTNEFNTYIEQFPTVIIARMFGFSRAASFGVENREEAEKAPSVKF
jgi:LemA protein